MKKLSLWGQQLSLILGGIMAGVFLGELALHLGGIKGLKKPSEPVSFETYRLDDPAGAWSLNPGASFEWQGEGERSFIQANKDGLRDREHTKEKPPKTFRIAVVGDSFAEALQVPMEKTFWWKMRKQLNKKCTALGDRKVEVINFGVQGYGTAQELMTLRHKVWKYSPDLVILAFFPGNDLINNSKKLDFYQRRPYFVYKNGELVPDMSWVKMSPKEHEYLNFSLVDYLPTWWVNNSRILRLVRQVDLENKKRLLDATEKKRFSKNFQEPIDPEWKEAWQVTEGLISLMNQEVKAKKADFMVLIVSTGSQVHPDPIARQGHMKQSGIKDLYYPNQRIKSLGDTLNITTLDTVPRLREYAEKNKTCVHGFPNALPCEGHWNSQGHEQVAQLMAQHLCDKFQAEPSGSTKNNALVK
ncbi:SGNH/GDSL hydrolase family protein [Microcoleus vaginatus]|uniref:SGNH/GDSL hydrolase family protein n=1 Tax=Microcoleus vaginatus TaxID=119532 RepID=UPI0016865339|nr:SGNH/GDSL hydrolase family protein [Microcoleus sp. FACHB-84]MBD2012255.1 SGNH/GDSL hydrolase family protein [Microcoleus sp. FACHB-45]